MKRFAIYIIVPMVLALIFWAAANQRKGSLTIRRTLTRSDSSEIILMRISIHDQSGRVAYMKEDSTWVIINAQATIESLLKYNQQKELKIERLKYSLQDLSQEIEERDREIAKLKERLKECK